MTPQHINVAASLLWSWLAGEERGKGYAFEEDCLLQLMSFRIGPDRKQLDEEEARAAFTLAALTNLIAIHDAACLMAYANMYPARRPLRAGEVLVRARTTNKP